MITLDDFKETTEFNQVKHFSIGVVTNSYFIVMRSNLIMAAERKINKRLVSNRNQLSGETNSNFLRNCKVTCEFFTFIKVRLEKVYIERILIVKILINPDSQNSSWEFLNLFLQR